MSQTKIDISNLSDSVVAALSVPKISAIVYPGDDTAASPSGGQQIVINGSGFLTGAQVYVDNVLVSVSSVLSSAQISFTSPAKVAGSYEIRIVNVDGGVAISNIYMQYSGTPVWNTPSGSLGNVYETKSFSSLLSATSDSNVTYSLASGTFPTGVSLSGNSISGTTGTVIGDTTYNFTIAAIDGENQDTNRTFNIGVLSDTVTWNSPANNTSYSGTIGNTFSQVLNATSAASSNITYTSNTLPSGLSISGNTISGTYATAANTSTLLTATASGSGKTSTRNISFTVINNIIAPGQVAYTSSGTHTWTAPAGVTSVCVVCVGGGTGGNSNNRAGGAGGSLGWKNNITVVPGQSYTVVVGAGGAGGSFPSAGGDSYFISLTTVKGGANRTYVGDGGGLGGIGYGGGGGAGGYSGNGGDGSSSGSGANGSGGGGGGGGDAGANGRGGGGGVGILGQGTSGLGSIYNGTGGSGGANGGEGSSGAFGGAYGGGGGGQVAGQGGSGAVRIIWGTGRAFPSTSTGNL